MSLKKQNLEEGATLQTFKRMSRRLQGKAAKPEAVLPSGR